MANEITNIVFNDFTIGNNIPISFKSSVPFESVRLELYIVQILVATREVSTTNTTIVLTESEKDVIYRLIPNSTSIPIKLSTLVYNNGSVGYGEPVTAIATVGNDIVPTFLSISTVETVSSVSTLVNSFVQNLSKIKIDINGAEGSKFSTITNYSISINNMQYNQQSIITDIINVSGNVNIVATVQDSRGRTFSRTKTINLLPYRLPQISLFNVNRCDAIGNASIFGTYAKILFNVSIGSFMVQGIEKNSLNYKLYVKERSIVTWGTPIKNVSTPNLSTNVSDILSGYIQTKSYDFKLTVTDIFNTTLSMLVLSTGQVTMSWGTVGIGAGKIWERGALDVGGDAYVLDNVYVNKDLYAIGDIYTKNNVESNSYQKVYSPRNKPSAQDIGALPLIGGNISGDLNVQGNFKIGGTKLNTMIPVQLYSAVDLNNMKTPGVYYCDDLTKVVSMLNLPFGSPFTLTVTDEGGGNITQKFISREKGGIYFDTNICVRYYYTTNGSKVWSQWDYFSPDNDKGIETDNNSYWKVYLPNGMRMYSSMIEIGKNNIATSIYPSGFFTTILPPQISEVCPNGNYVTYSVNGKTCVLEWSTTQCKIGNYDSTLTARVIVLTVGRG